MRGRARRYCESGSAAAAGTDALVVVLHPLTGAPLGQFRALDSVANGIRLAAGDLDGDGRDELVAAPGFGGNGQVRIFDSRLRQVTEFSAYDWAGAGTNVAVAARVGFPIAAEPRRLRFVAGNRKRPLVARFRDAAVSASSGHFRAWIDWGDGTAWNGAVLRRGGGVYDVRSTKRYAGRGRYDITVTLRDDRGRSSTARGIAIVSRGTKPR